MMLAWMTVRASVTLAALLTAILLPLAWVVAWKSRKEPLRALLRLAFALALVFLVGMTWRGETWKYQCLKLEEYLAEQQPQQVASSKLRSGSFDQRLAFLARRQEFDFQPLLFRRVVSPDRPVIASVQSRREVLLDAVRKTQSRLMCLDSIVPLIGSDMYLCSASSDRF